MLTSIIAQRLRRQTYVAKMYTPILLLTMTHWYLLYTKARSEETAQNNLRNQGFTCFYPRIRALSNKRKIAQDEPLFPRYVFVELARHDNWQPIRSTRGVIKLVNFGKDQLPQPVPGKVVLELKKRDFLRVARALNRLPEVGTQVKLRIGSSEVDAIVQQYSPDARVQVLYQLLGQQQSGWVDADKLALGG